MLTNRVRTLILACGICLIASSTCGQNLTPVKLQFVAFPKIANPEPIELVTAQDETMLVKLPSNNLSPTYEVPPLKKWILGKSVIDEETNQPSFEVYGETPSVSSLEQIVLVIREGTKDSDGFKLVPFASNDSGFSGGKYLFFNGTKVNIAAIVGDQKFVLKPNNHTLVAPGPSTIVNDRKYLYTYLYVYGNNRPKPFYASTWRFSEKARSLVFFYNDPHTDQVRTHSIRNYLP